MPAAAQVFVVIVTIATLLPAWRAMTLMRRLVARQAIGVEPEVRAGRRFLGGGTET